MNSPHNLSRMHADCMWEFIHSIPPSHEAGQGNASLILSMKSQSQLHYVTHTPFSIHWVEEHNQENVLLLQWQQQEFQWKCITIIIKTNKKWNAAEQRQWGITRRRRKGTTFIEKVIPSAKNQEWNKETIKRTRKIRQVH